MSEFRGQLLDRMIRIYGFENPLVINFARACEDTRVWDVTLLYIVEEHEKAPQGFDEEE